MSVPRVCANKSRDLAAGHDVAAPPYWRYLPVFWRFPPP
jgi:hypothetical protein